MASGCTAIPGLDDAEQFKLVCSAMASIGLDESQQDQVPILARLFVITIVMGPVAIHAQLGTYATHFSPLASIVEDVCCCS